MPRSSKPEHAEIQTTDYQSLLSDVKERVRSAQYAALKAVNKELIALYWEIGRLIVERQEAEGWGKSIVERLAADLQKEFPGVSGFSMQNIWYMRQLYQEILFIEKFLERKIMNCLKPIQVLIVHL